MVGNCAVKPKKAIKIGKPFSITGNALNRDFTADKPMQKLTTDITYLPFGPKRLYLSSIMDLHMEKSLRIQLVQNKILSLYWIL